MPTSDTSSATRPTTCGHTLSISSPASRFIDAFLCGNGSLGATVYGQPGCEHLDLNHDSLWSGGPDSRRAIPTVPRDVVDNLRQAIARHDHACVNELARRLQSDGWSQSYQPVGSLRWAWGALPTAGSDYSRSLDMSRAITHVRNGAEEMSLFVSAPDGVIVGLTHPVSPECPPPALAFSSPHPLAWLEEHSGDGELWLTATGRAPSQALPSYVEHDNPVVYGDEPSSPGARAEAGAGWAVVAASRRLPDGRGLLVATVSTGVDMPWCATQDEGNTPASVEVSDASSHTLPKGVSIDLDAIAEEARLRVQRALKFSPEELIARHEADYSRLYCQASLDLRDSDSAQATRAEQYFNLGRYLLISSSRPGTYPATLQGIWNTRVQADWSSNYTTNINAEMNYWGAHLVGLSRTYLPLLDLTRHLSRVGRTSATQIYGAPGAVVHHNTDIWGFSPAVSGDPVWANWSMGLAWLATHACEHLAFTRSGQESIDRPAYEELWELLSPVASFILSQLCPIPDAAASPASASKGAGGVAQGGTVAGTGGASQAELVVCPSSSPEHEFVDAGIHCAVTYGSSIDQELAWFILTRLTQVGHYLGYGAPGCSQWGLMREAEEGLSRLHLPTIATDGRLEEWAGGFDGAEPGHRHLSHLWGFFPGDRITGATPELVDAVRRSLEARLRHGSGYTGWSQAWILALAARLRDRELASRALEHLTDDLASLSLLDLHPRAEDPSDPIFQIDGNLGAVAGMCELLVQSHEGAIALLPCLPTDWKAGVVRGIRTRLGISVDVEWKNSAVTQAYLHAQRATTAVIFSSSAPQVMVDGVSVQARTQGNERWYWSMEAGTTALIHNIDAGCARRDWQQ